LAVDLRVAAVKSSAMSERKDAEFRRTIGERYSEWLKGLQYQDYQEAG
jgi:hypothetical protein